MAKALATGNRRGLRRDIGGSGVALGDNRVGRREWEGRLTEAPDLIEPPAAREPAEVLLLACAALTDGDLEAAVALYEPGATLSWGQDHSAAGHAAIRQVLAGVMDMRLPLRARAVRVLRAGPLALITAERTLTGTGLDGVAVTLTGPAALVARRQPGGTWLTAADQWLPYPGSGASAAPPGS
jgi:ketosteroid isomerase-like protein